jgi:tRNA nucleotidyltransferase/poly(A) polymerase
MKLRDLLNILQSVAKEHDISQPYIVGGIPRDRMLGIIKNEVPDLDICTGNNLVKNLAKEFSIILGKQVSIETKTMNDGHISVFIGDFKIDFSSDFVVPGIDKLLFTRGIKNPTDMQKELFSRDFTANALLLTLDLKTIKDPIHMGINDINKKILKTCLTPEITLTSNRNRIVRVIYLSAKLDFDVDPNIIKFISEHKNLIKSSSETYIKKNIDRAMKYNSERALYIINKTKLWDVLPIADTLLPYSKNVVAQIRRNFDYGERLLKLDKEKKEPNLVKKRLKRKKKLINKLRKIK